MNETQQNIVNTYISLIEENKVIPSYADFLPSNITRDTIKYYFGNIEKLHKYMSDNHSDDISKHITTVDHVFGKLKTFNSKRYVITTAVADSPVDENFLASLNNYCSIKDAQLIIMPCESITNSFENRTATFDPKLMNYDFLSEDTNLNNNITLASIQVSAKQIKPTTGLSRIGRREGSYVFAAPKQFLEYIPSGNDRGKNYAIMTPGACTKPSYYTTTFVSKRLSYIAQHDHTLGALIVEIVDDNTFHFRQIQADEDGSFIDLCKRYDANTVTDVPVHIILGDIHGVQLNMDVANRFIESFKDKSVKSLFLHDTLDALSINHHIQTIGERAKRLINNLESELEETLDNMLLLDNGLSPETLYIVKSNHDEFLDRYLKEARYASDAENHRFALKCAHGIFEEEDTFRYALRMLDYNIPKHWLFLQREDSVKIAGVECAAHGDLGLNGARSSINSLEKIYGECVVAHSHSGAIQRGVFRVGTFSDLDMEYNRGPSSWTHTACLLYDNGQRQLVNFIDGDFFLED